MNKTLALPLLLAALGGCSGMPATTSAAGSPMSVDARAASQDSLPQAVRVPSGTRIAMETVGVGEISYECQAKPGAAGTYEWVFGGPKASLASRDGATVGSYYGPPATWESKDGSKLTGTQVAVAPRLAEAADRALGREVWLRAAILVIAGVVAAANALSGPLVLDDHDTIVMNEQIR